jgi:hypothetical protein
MLEGLLAHRVSKLLHVNKVVEVPGFEPCFHREAKSLADADLIGSYNLRTGILEQPSARK